MHRVVSLFLALLLFVGSVGVTVNRHFCMGELRSVALFAAAEVCHEDAAAPACPLHAAAKKDCCNNEHELVKSDIDQQVVDAGDLPTPPAFAPSLPPAPTPSYTLHLRARANKTFENYRPPPRLIDVPRRFQVFRI
ncbi:hypothetical protein LEM8419_00506 [Neolewinella maritima]|uniref:Secreted protein n=1 Tax=Neolewinella maritima TaxID=1383882 RepID=A0ABM9AYC3_9BACT|nr:hypothetical protein [Neolewinella maritima]CAH0999209.1 hypothetical protein LEM8419_00506 [Neolewinella maritima]